MSRKQIQSLPDVAEKVNKYREETRALIAKYQPNEVFNSDQSGFNIELLSGRTLTEKGDKKVVSSIHQSHSGTHSYTIQPLISMTGHLYPRLLIVLQEKSGKFGPVVLQNLFTHPEILVLANSSGKVTKEVLKEWFTEIYFPSFNSKSLLLLDSYSGHKDLKDIDKLLPQNKTYQVSQISPGITGFCQPLDVHFFRSYKSFHRQVSDYINNHRPDLKLYERNIVLKLQACTFFQFRSPRFIEFIKFAWFKAGLYEIYDRAQFFEDPMEYCFYKTVDMNKCIAENCSEICFIRCSWCKKMLCFDHLFHKKIQSNDRSFLQFHYCNTYEP